MKSSGLRLYGLVEDEFDDEFEEELDEELVPSRFDVRPDAIVLM
jgi:hypothetical protein